MGELALEYDEPESSASIWPRSELVEVRPGPEYLRKERKEMLYEFFQFLKRPIKLRLIHRSKETAICSTQNCVILTSYETMTTMTLEE